MLLNTTRIIGGAGTTLFVLLIIEDITGRQPGRKRQKPE